MISIMSRENRNVPPLAGSNEPIASAPVLARWLGISGKAVYELAKAGVLVRVSRDQFLLEESVRRKGRPFLGICVGM